MNAIYLPFSRQPVDGFQNHLDLLLVHTAQAAGPNVAHQETLRSGRGLCWGLALFEAPYHCWCTDDGRSHVCQAIVYSHFDTPDADEPQWEVWHCGDHDTARHLWANVLVERST